MSAARAILLALGWGFVATLVSSLIESRQTAVYPEIMGCETGCQVTAGGWPFPYLVDHPALSVVNAVSLTGAATGEDKLVWSAFLQSWGCWSLLLAILIVAISRIRRRS